MRRGKGRRAVLSLFVLLIPILACSPRPLMRFIRGLACPPVALLESESHVVRLNASAKMTAPKAIAQRPLNVRSGSSVHQPSPPRPEPALAAARPAPLHFPPRSRDSRRVELLKPAYLRAFDLGVSGPIPPG